MKTKLSLQTLALPAMLLSTLISPRVTCFAQGTAFSFQGQLNDGSSAATGSYDLRFAIYDTASGGAQLGGVLTNAAATVSNGRFTATLDFGAGVFTGADRWLEIAVRTNGGAAFTTLAPRDKITATPYAIYSGLATSANGVAPSSVGAPQLSTPGSPSAGQVLGYSGGGLVWTNPPASSGGWSLTGNAGTTAGQNFLGTTDDRPFELKVNGTRALRLESAWSFSSGSSVNTIGGLAVNNVLNGAIGATIAGGGAGTLSGDIPNEVGADFGTIGGGWGNHVGGTLGTIPGGVGNWANGYGSFAAGQFAQAHHDGAFVWNGYSRPAGSFVEQRFHVFGYNGFSVDYSNQRPDGGGSSWAGIGLFPGQTISTWTGAFLEDNGDWHCRNVIAYGEGNELAYLGGDGTGGDVQIGSMNPGVSVIACYNTANNTYMDMYVRTLTILGGGDLAEPFPMSGAEIAEGSVVIIDDEHSGRLKLSDEPYDTRVAGVVSGAGGIHPGVSLKQQGKLDAGQNVALTGRVYVLADAGNGAIKPGDLLTTSSTPGHAMKVTDHARAQGAILGKAMSSVKEGKGMVLVLVTLQ